MELSYQRPIDLNSHPLVQQKYIVPTPSIEEMYLRVKKLIRLRTPGGIIYAHPRFGKTYGIRYVTRVLMADYPKAVLLSFGCQKKKNHSEDAFFSVLLEAVAHNGALTGSITKKRSRLNDRIVELVDRSGYNWFILFADEAQRLDVIEYEWLRDLHDELERRDIRMITFLVGQPQLLNQKSAMRMSRQTQIVSRFMIDEMQFRGIVSVDDLATCLGGYDVAFFPEGSSWSFTRYFLPCAYENGFRLLNQANLLWDRFLAAHEEARFEYDLEIPMQYFARSVEIALLESMEFDSMDFAITSKMWDRAIAESNFISAQEELRIVMNEDFNIRN